MADQFVYLWDDTGRLYLRIGNLLHYTVDAAARCLAVGSTTYPCSANMQNTANALFAIGNATFANNACSGTGLSSTYDVSIL
jgi:hypothetical protein